MPYTIRHRGQPIGTTDLAFTRTGGPVRAGWFHPNAEGERLMPRVSAVHAALRAYGEWRRDLATTPPAPPAPGDPATAALPEGLASSPLVDVIEAFQHAAALELTLHREDGSLVPTEDVGIQDTHELRITAERERARREAEPWQFDETVYDELAASAGELRDVGDGDGALPVELEALTEAELDALPLGDLPDPGEELPWSPDGEEDGDAELPRFQVIVFLKDERDVP